MADWVIELGGLCETSDNAMTGLAVITGAAKAGTPFQVMVLDDGLSGLSDLLAVLRSAPTLNDMSVTLLISDAQTAPPASRKVVHCLKPASEAMLRDALCESLGPLHVTSTPRVSTPPTTVGKALRLLVADDNAVNQQVAVGLLSSLGHRADVAGDGQEALVMAEQYQYDLIFMDMQMPIMDGVAATKAIRALASDKANIPIIAMTANAMTEDRETCLAAGMNDYIAKPIDRRQLTEILNRWSNQLN